MTLRVVAALVWIAALTAIVACLALWASRGFPRHPAGYATTLLGISGIAIAAIAYATAGFSLSSMSPRNLLGWVLLGAGAGLAFILVVNQYIETTVQPFRSVPYATLLLAWFVGSVHLPTSAAAVVIAVLLFPAGRLEWRPMRVAVALAIVGCVLLAMSTALRPDGMLWYPTLPSPLVLPMSLAPFVTAMSLAGMVAFVSAFGLVAVCLAWRFKHGHAEHRHQLAWVALGGTVMAVTLGSLFAARYSGMVTDADGERLLFIAAVGSIVLPITLLRFTRITAAHGVKVPDMTFLFTDLEGSSDMYRRIGDQPAFDLVRLHFDTLGAITRARGGAVVKTIGDAIMAAFPDPADAVRTAFEMFERLEQMNVRRSSGLVLKVGVHRGPVIAVGKRERPDYFGQTVNAAARLQQASAAGEIVLSDDVYRGAGVAELLEGHDVHPETADLRGVADDMPVYRVSVAHPADASSTSRPTSVAPESAMG